jgi:glycosyltransferase involved in cell wall biosynthesis
MTRSVLVVPCFNEEKRIDRTAFAALAKTDDLTVLFVDDGSKDGTLGVLRELEARAPSKIRVLAVEKNGGKGEAVRKGMLDGLALGASVVGYGDADLATPPAELLRLERKVVEGGPSVVVGSRVLVVGTQIERSLVRHLLGRVFATFAANIVEMPFYDTQCGAKFFRDTPALRAALAKPFLSRWAFDIELLGRLRIGTRDVPGLPIADFREVPLERWIDIPDSKLRMGGMAKTLADLARIDRELARMRRAARDVIPKVRR